MEWIQLCEDNEFHNVVISLKASNTIVMVTHDSTIVNNNKKRTIALEEGYIVADIKKGGYIK